MSLKDGASTGFDYHKLAAELSAAGTDSDLFETIVNAPFSHPLPAALIFLGIIVFLQVDKAAGTINRITLSKTEQARQTTDVSVVPFHEIKIPLDYHENVIADAIASGTPSDTTDWKFLFNPALAASEARINQANAGFAYSAVYPLKSRDGGALIFSYYQYQHEIGDKQTGFMKTYTELVDKALAK
jgi:hypothetical protein